MGQHLDQGVCGKAKYALRRSGLMADQLWLILVWWQINFGWS